MKRTKMSEVFSRIKNSWRLLPKKKQNFILTILSGALLALSFNIGSLWFLGLVALVPLFVVLKNTKNLFESVLHGFTLGIIYFGSVLWFFFSAHPLNWAGIENNATSFIAVFVTWILTASVLSVGPIIFSAVIHLMRNGRFFLFLAPLAWALAEIFQATFLSIVLAGESSLLGAHWTFGFLGYILAENALLLSLAALGGVSFLSFVVVIANAIFYNIFTKKKFNLPEKLSAVTIFILASAFYFYSPAPTETKKVAALYTDFAPAFLQGTAEQRRQFIETDNLLRQLSSTNEHFDIIVFPENTFYFMQLTTDFGVQYRLESLSRGGEVTIIDSLRTDVPGPDKSKLIFVNSEDTRGHSKVSAHTKQLLVPQGEYLSYGYSLLGKFFLGEEWFEKFNNSRALEKGHEIVLGTSGNVKIGALFCSEVLTPSLYREVTKSGAGILINSASHSIFNNSESLSRQILKYSKLRAAENGRHFVQAGNGVSSFALDEKGRLLDRFEGKGGGFLKTQVEAFSHITPFAFLGTKGVMTIVLTLFGILLIQEVRMTRKIAIKK